MMMIIIACGIGSTTIAQSQDERIRSSYVMAFGRDASGGEITYWKGQGNLSFNDLISRHKGWIMQDAGTHQGVINRAYIDALGRNPTSGEIAYWMKGNETYTELMGKHITFLQNNKDEYGKTINRSYKFVFGRDGSAGEISYWKGQPVASYIGLVAYHQDYKARNGNLINGKATVEPSSMITGVRISNQMLGEIKGSNIMVSVGANIVAAGGGNMVAAGGGNMVAAGGGNMVAAGGGN